ncbi:MAG: phosphoglucomutase/phosphomannomutase family protein [Clostridia bacterium]|nr:phosphoglucomutase/phosphomannomutase family protein [Clostridia bacterium]
MSKVKFGTGGFRAVIGEDFNKENVQLICQAIANIMIRNNLKKEVCIGYDNRFMSEVFARWGAEVFAGNDITALMTDCSVSTPVVMYATKVRNNDYGIMITASHNPYEYNGVKAIIKGGKDAGIEETNEIEQELEKINEINSCEDSELIKYINYNDEYIDNIINLFELKSLKNLKVVFDNKYGSTAKEIKLLCQKLGITKYSIINENRDAFFNFKMPAPTIDNISDLQWVVLRDKADIGFALDADGDRLAVIDNYGNYIDNNYILAIAYYFLVKYCGKTGNSVKNVATSNLLDIVTNKCGYDCIEVPVGFKHVFKALLERDAIIGGESSGGLAIHGHVGGKDSLLAISLCLKAMSVMKKTFKEIFEEVLEFANNYSKVIMDKQYDYTLEQKEYIDSILNKRILPPHRYEIEKIDYQDYIKIYYTNGNWVLIRFSGTEPILRIFAETDSEEESLHLIEDWQKLLRV